MYGWYIFKQGRCSSWHPSPLKLTCYQQSSAIRGEKIPLHSPSTIQSSNLFGKGLEKQSFWSCTTASHYQSHLPTFVSYIFLSSSSSVLLPSCLPLIVFVFLCPCHCRALALFCFFSPLPCSARLTSSSSILFADSFLQFLFTPVLSTLWWKLGAVPSSPTQSSLTDSFISSAANPFNTTCLICLPPPFPNLKHTHPHIIYNWILHTH